MLLRSPGPISPDTYSGHIRRRALCPNRLRNGMSQRSSSSRQSDILPTMVGPSKSRPPMSHRKTDLGIPCRTKLHKVVLNRVNIIEAVRHKRQDEPFNLNHDLEPLAAKLAASHEVKLIVIDPISAYLGDTDSHNNSQVRGVLAPLAKLA